VVGGIHKYIAAVCPTNYFASYGYLKLDILNIKLYKPMNLIRRIFRKIAIKYLLEDPQTCDHEWEVYNVALKDHCLELSCNKCALVGSVYNPTDKEWERGLTSPSKPYIWEDLSRVEKGHFQLI
jgi:hypothetical protein